MATNKTALARTGHKPATPPPSPKAAPSPAQQAAREKFALARRQNSAPAAAPRPRTGSMVARERPEKETLGKIIGGEAPTLIASGALGALNASQMGQNIEEKFGVKPSRAVGVAAMAAKLLNVDGIAGPAVSRGAGAVIRSELNDLARSGAGSLMKKVSQELDSKKSETETKVEEKASSTEIAKTSSTPHTNGVAPKTEPKTPEKQPTA